MLSPHKLTEEGREAKRQEQRKQKSILWRIPDFLGEVTIQSWFLIGLCPSGYTLSSYFHSFPIYIYSHPTLGTKMLTYTPEASGQRKSLVGDEETQK